MLVLLPGCRNESRLNPEEPLATLPPSAGAQLCRFTTDSLGDADFSACPSPDAWTDFDACVAAPPWAGYETVGAWEDCVNARLDAPCLEGPPCAP